MSFCTKIVTVQPTSRSTFCFSNSFSFLAMSLFLCRMYLSMASLSNRYPSGLQRKFKACVFHEDYQRINIQWMSIVKDLEKNNHQQFYYITISDSGLNIITISFVPFYFKTFRTWLDHRTHVITGFSQGCSVRQQQSNS